ncbi:MAG TPA: hypothetical protein V6C65_15090, partial [Allocoleopsis sp.]
ALNPFRRYYVILFPIRSGKKKQFIFLNFCHFQKRHVIRRGERAKQSFDVVGKAHSSSSLTLEMVDQ